MRTIGRGTRTDSGAATVELALILPVLVMLITGIIFFGMLYNAQIQLSGAVRDAARSIALGGTSIQAPATTLQQQVQTNLRSAAPGVTVESITVTQGTTAFTDASGNPACPNPLPAPPAAGSTTPWPPKVSVIAHIDVSSILPFFPSNSFRVRAKGMIACEL